MTYKVGNRLRTHTSTAEVIVVRLGSGSGEFVCAGGVMTTEPVTPELQSGEHVQLQLGKRYADAESGVEVLCTAPGAGPLMFAGRELSVKSAKQLPSSD
ncbi:hypothetical protein [Pseudonocardia oroxyli]|uniref:Uncharacterized protein n=1 Tax=Pseudonocardia oroxyli TaxID=366584 RepID=A0A1G8EJ63_PSEOR|nr:hypothetical protein [Pseudonocardia oroxyli]SDH69907.1 hypothetical protein SAMN05216377_1379 [Pseudonocardia oroxyli]